MEEVKGVVIVLYTIKNGHPRIAVLKRTLNWEGWELVKGRKDDDEDPKETARREIKEETGIDPASITILDDTHEWTYERDGTKYHAIYDTCIARAPDGARIQVQHNNDEEHEKGFFLNPRDAKDILTHENQQSLIESVTDRLEE
ncbi:MAG: NUDIX domain-containing protein [Candidatus Nanohaloarchaeota archaeon QJJ-5]|nr:NUDIX domain-containing protein [Candidatus Nanohaloarchaeota archaeon QJJ-5]